MTRRKYAMKKFTQILVAVFMMMGTFAFATGSTSAAEAGFPKTAVKKMANVEITLQNKCTRDVKYTLKSGASATNGTIAKGDKVKVNVAVGTQVVVDGDVVMTVADSDAGQTFCVCR
jgi:hypothetical protein